MKKLLILVLLLLPCWTSRAQISSQALYLQALTNFETYAETIWHAATYSNAPVDAGYWGDGGSSGNGGIRGNSGIAVAYAVLVVAQPGNANNPTRLARIRQALNYDAGTHITGTNVCVDGKQWGWKSSSSGEWQTPLWTGSMGLACMLVEGSLSPQTVAACKRVVASEADNRAAIPPASGYVGDTKAEENGWDSNVLALGAAWMSAHPNAPDWMSAAKAYLANTYTVPDTSGDPLADWVTTTTLYPSFALENHGFYHPTYEMVAGMSMGDSLLVARIGNEVVAAQLQAFAEHNVMNVWSNNLQSMVMLSGDFAYPSGLDWELHDYEQNSYIAWLAAHFNDPVARWTDAQLAQLVRYRQQVNGDGRFVGPSGGGFYREAVEARRTAIAWLHWQYANFPVGPSSPPAPITVHFPDVKVISQRSSFGNVSVSYGSRIMAMIEPAPGSLPTNAFLSSPLLPGTIGLGSLGNPASAELIALSTNTVGFDAELNLTHSSGGSTRVYIKSTAESIGLVEVPFPPANVSEAQARSFSTGIENDPLTGGSRLLEWAAGAAVITNRSGAAKNITNRWVCVAGRLGVAAGPDGYFNYSAPTTYNRSGAAQDTLGFYAATPNGPRYAVYFPNKTAAQTAILASAIGWSATLSNVVLSFPGNAGSPAQIKAPVPLPAPYPPYVLPVSSIVASSTQSGTYPATNAIDGILTNFWVSLYGPTNHAEWLLVRFPRPSAIAGFKVYPRTLNGGYGPKDIQVVMNITNSIPASGVPASGTNIFAGRMLGTANLAVTLDEPIIATNAALVILSGYDPASPNSPRNTQVIELSFFERALPGTFADWRIRNFSDTALADPEVSSANSDPDGDGILNLAECGSGGDPFIADRSFGELRAVSVSPAAFKLEFHRRLNMVDVDLVFEASSDLEHWTQVFPSDARTLSILNDVALQEATFTAPSGPQFVRMRFTAPQ